MQMIKLNERSKMELLRSRIAGPERFGVAVLRLALVIVLLILGHGPVGEKAGLVEFRDMLVAIRSSIEEGKKQGRSLSGILAAKATAAFDAKLGNFVMSLAAFLSLVHRGGLASFHERAR
jgi:hypothetical protein